VIDNNKCNGCAACMDACDVGAIYLVDNKAEIDQTQCTACGVCVDVCPTDAISVERVELEQHQAPMSPSVKQSIVSAVKSTAVTLGSTILPIAISKIGDFLAIKLEDGARSSSYKNKTVNSNGKRFQRKYRRGRKGS